MDDITTRLQTLHSQTVLATQGISEKDILDEQARCEKLMKELSNLRVISNENL